MSWHVVFYLLTGFMFAFQVSSKAHISMIEEETGRPVTAGSLAISMAIFLFLWPFPVAVRLIFSAIR